MTLNDVPADLLRAISHANKILDWHENMVEDDIPPEWMWSFDEPLTQWFKDLKEERKQGHPTSEHTEVPMMENELAAGRGR